MSKVSLKSTGIVRHLDDLGRITLPIELRRILNFDDREAVEIYVDESNIILHKYEPADVFNGSKNNLIDFQGKKVSVDSIRALVKKAGLTLTEEATFLPPAKATKTTKSKKTSSTRKASKPKRNQ